MVDPMLLQEAPVCADETAGYRPPANQRTNRKNSTGVCAPVRRVFSRLCPGTDHLFLEPVFAAEFSEVVAGLGVGVVLGLLHKIASNL